MGWKSWCAVHQAAEKGFPYSSPGREGFEDEQAYANLSQSGTEQEEILGEEHIRVPISNRSLGVGGWE